MKINAIFASIFLCFLLLGFTAFAQNLNTVPGNYKSSIGETSPVKLPNPLGEGKDKPQELIGQVINAVLGIVGSIALAMFIFGGFTWMTASGNEQAITKGKDILVWATVGLIVIFTSYALVKFIIFKGLGAPEAT